MSSLDPSPEALKQAERALCIGTHWCDGNSFDGRKHDYDCPARNEKAQERVARALDEWEQRGTEALRADKEKLEVACDTVLILLREARNPGSKASLKKIEAAICRGFASDFKFNVARTTADKETP